MSRPVPTIAGVAARRHALVSLLMAAVAAVVAGAFGGCSVGYLQQDGDGAWHLSNGGLPGTRTQSAAETGVTSPRATPGRSTNGR